MNLSLLCLLCKEDVVLFFGGGEGGGRGLLCNFLLPFSCFLISFVMLTIVLQGLETT